MIARPDCKTLRFLDNPSETAAIHGSGGQVCGKAAVSIRAAPIFRGNPGLACLIGILSKPLKY
jgi:hypothetical protein